MSGVGERCIRHDTGASTGGTLVFGGRNNRRKQTEVIMES